MYVVTYIFIESYMLLRLLQYVVNHVFIEKQLSPFSVEIQEGPENNYWDRPPLGTFIPLSAPYFIMFPKKIYQCK